MIAYVCLEMVRRGWEEREREEKGRGERRIFILVRG